MGKKFLFYMEKNFFFWFNTGANHLASLSGGDWALMEA